MYTQYMSLAVSCHARRKSCAMYVDVTRRLPGAATPPWFGPHRPAIFH